MNMKCYLGILSVLVCISLCQSCKKGCTNPTAFNYNRSAKVDDGSCLYCDSVLSAGNNNEVFLVDNNASSQFFNQDVLEMIVTSNFSAYNGNGCAILGKNNNSSTGTANTYYTGLLQNETSSTVTFSGTIEIEVFQNSGDIVNNYTISNVTIPPNGSVNINIGSGGQQVEFSSFEIFSLSSNFSYH